MKKLLSILFLSIYMFSAFQISEYLKIPILVKHYNEHKQENPKLNLWNFICDHYAHGEVFDADYEKDMKLPFKTFDTCNYASINFYTPIQEFQFSKNISIKLYKTALYKYDFSFSSNFHSAIWQPPKSC